MKQLFNTMGLLKFYPNIKKGYMSLFGKERAKVSFGMASVVYLLGTFFFLSCQMEHQEQSVIQNQQSVMDLKGVYKGVYPCADCGGIQATLSLAKDSTFMYETIYLGKKDGRFVEQGTYSAKANILTIKTPKEPLYFMIEDNSLMFLGHNMKPDTSVLASYYELKKQSDFHLQGQYETFNEDEEAYKQTLSIQKIENQYQLVFSASKVKNRENCHFSGVGTLKNDTIWVNIAIEDDKEIWMYVIPSHDNLGVEVFTKNYEERFAMMYYCGGGSSLAGKYIKNTITPNSISVFNSENTIEEVLQMLPNVQIQKKKAQGEFVDDVYDDYEIYNHNNQLLFTLTAKDTGNVHQKINRILIHTPFFKTDKGINKNSTFKAIKEAYKINSIETDENHIVLVVNELNAHFSIKKSHLKKAWWDDKNKKVNQDKISLDAPIDQFILWWNE